jgi:hypothetical protein
MNRKILLPLGLVVALTHDLIQSASPLQPFLTEHCIDCHDRETHKGGLDLEELAPSFATRDQRRKWTLIFDRIEHGEMPPAKKRRPPAAAQRAALQWIGAQINAAELQAHAADGRTLARRLNRVEYQNTIRDLLRVHVDIASLLPEDGSAAGFDNVDMALDVSAMHLEKYLEAADVALTAALVKGPRPPVIKERISYLLDADPRTPIYTTTLGKGQRQILALPDAAVFTNEQYPPKQLPKFSASFPGRYRFQLSAYAHQSEQPVTAMVVAGSQSSSKGRTAMTQVFSVKPGTPQLFAWEDMLDKGDRLRLLTREPNKNYNVQPEDYKGPGLAVQWVEVEGPILSGWPPPSVTGLVGDLDLAKGTMADAEKILRDFLPRAFRRPITDADVQPYLGLMRAKFDKGPKYPDALRAGLQFEGVLRVGLKAALVSHDFLYLQNPPGKLTDHALATRLSYFLWSTMPDDTLFALAAKHELTKPAHLHAQVERMLADPKAAALTENFTGQWLKLREIDATTPDKKLYPEFDDVLAWSMVRETRAFFDELLTRNLSVLNFVQSDFAILNARLAELYGIPGVEGMDFRRVALQPEWHRGGVLSQAAVLKVTANGTTTSPIPRGAFVLGRLLGRPPPPPPADVPAIEPDIRGASSIREMLEKHRADPSCAVCHAKIDPPGSALENYDVIGGWRTFYRKPQAGGGAVVFGPDRRRYSFGKGVPCETDGALPDGTKFANADEFKQALLADPARREQIIRAFTERLLVYATGHVLDFADRRTITQIVEATRANHHGLRSLVQAVVQSSTFQSK